MLKRYGFLLLLCSTWIAPSAWAAHKCVGDDGRVSYQETPCPGAVQDRQVPTQVRQRPAVNKDVMTPDEIMAAVEAQRERDKAKPVRPAPVVAAEEPEKVVSVGMVSDAVLNAWGKPNAVNKTQMAHGTTEQWVYYRGRYKRQYVYLLNGVVRSIQTQE